MVTKSGITDPKAETMKMFSSREVEMIIVVIFIVALLLGFLFGFVIFHSSSKDGGKDVEVNNVANGVVKMKEDIIANLKTELSACKDTKLSSFTPTNTTALSVVDIEKAVEKVCGPKVAKPKAHVSKDGHLAEELKNLKQKIAAMEAERNKPQPQPQIQTQPQPQVQTQVLPEIKPERKASFWGWVHPYATAENPKVCYSDRQITGKPAQCSEVKVFASVSDETEEQWNARVAAQEGIKVGNRDDKGLITGIIFKRF